VHYAHKIVCNCIEISLKSRIYFTFCVKGEIRNLGYPSEYHTVLSGPIRIRDISVGETDKKNNSSDLHAVVVLSRLDARISGHPCSCTAELPAGTSPRNNHSNGD
jgi:hypothetical protein